MSEQAIVDTSALIALEKINTVHVMTFIKSAYDKTIELRDKGFYVSDKLLEEISRFKVSDTISNP